MKRFRLQILIFTTACLLAGATQTHATEPVIRPLPEPEPEATHKVLWRTDPGIRYELLESEDLENWTPVAGFPTQAEALAQQHRFEVKHAARFFKVRVLDEQPPRIVNRRPAADAFAVGRFFTVEVELKDASGVDPETIGLTVGAHGPFAIGDPELTWDGERLVLDLGGDVALGGYGESIEVELEVADVHGNTADMSWAFELEVAPVPAENLFIFGSPSAARAGQAIAPGPARVLFDRQAGGPIRMNAGADPWELEAVEEDRLVIAYAGETAPEFVVDTLVANLTPRSPGEVFYRRITGVEDDAATGRLTLFTEEAALEELIEEGSLTLTEEAVVFEEDAFGEFSAARSLGVALTFDTIGFSKSSIQVINTDAFGLAFGQLTWTFTPALEAAFDFRSFRLQRMQTGARGTFQAELRPQVTISQAISGNFQHPLFAVERSFYLGAIGPVPVWGKLGLSLNLDAGYEASVTGTLSSGASQSLHLAFGARYDRTATPALEWQRSSILSPPMLLPITATLAGSAKGHARLVPQFDITYLRVARVFANVNPGFTVEGEGSIGTGGMEPASWSMQADAALNLGAEITAFDLGGIGLQVKLFDHVWTQTQPEPGELHFTRQPLDVSAVEGDTVVLSATAVAAEPVTYQWFQDELPLLGEKAEDLTLEEVGPGHAGPYWVEARAGGQTAVSEVAEVEVELSEADNDDVGPGEGGDEFVRVAGGTIETPSGALTVETFLIGRFEVTWGEWQRVRAWALENGYSFGAGQGCTDDHPVTEVAAADIFKYCNARSEMEDLKPVYTVNGDPKWNSLTAFPTKDFSADGYRLPTADEWNYAARGGQQTQGFIYSGSDVLDNVGWYQGNSENSDCPLMPHAHTLGTWPVGLKQPNELGLHDMSGNVDEWVWFLGFMNRMVFRGGSCLSGSAQAEVGASLQLSPFISRVSNRGFRLALNN